ncbi:response regulator [Hyalangium gracile]|uniref:response regulator n=1 Tax=Hyalangium gracile TaxID=394092 RepID=UPI001CCB5E26|nr:response regulator [Hyalangium gracile]
MLSELRMPVMDGFHFLSYLMDHGFELPIVLASAPGAQQPLHYVLAPGRGIACPLSSSRPSRGCQELHASRASSNAMRHGVTLVEFLRYCFEQRQTHVLEVSAGEHTAELHLTFGQLTHACGEGREGLPVLLEMMGWKEPCLRILPKLPGTRNSITEAMEPLLRQAETLQSLSSDPSLVPEAPRSPSTTDQGRSWLSGWMRSWLADLLHAHSLSVFSPRMRRDPGLFDVVSSGRGEAGAESPAR